MPRKATRRKATRRKVTRRKGTLHAFGAAAEEVFGGVVAGDGVAFQRENVGVDGVEEVGDHGEEGVFDFVGGG